RAMDGPILSTTMKPCRPGSTSVPCSSTTRVETPGTARVAQPGLDAVWGASSAKVPAGANWGACGRGEQTVEPVSDCHQVSMKDAVPPPTCVRSHRQASGLMDSPTDPSRRTDERLYLPAGGPSGKAPMRERIRVGAV